MGARDVTIARDSGETVAKLSPRVPIASAAPPSVAAVLASVATFALEGVRQPRGHGRGRRPPRPAHVHARRACPTAAVRESRERVRAALLNSGLEFPLKRLTVNLAPAHLRKAGPSFDLAIAVGVLAASGQVPPERARALRRLRRALARAARCGRSAARSPLALGARARRATSG